VARKARAAKPYRASVPVICVGNLTAGGSGKTPVAIAVAKRLLARGERIFFLTRGYGGSETGPLLVQDHDAAAVGDEALLLARTAPTVVAKDRAAGAAFAVRHGATGIVMDDGHQNFSLAKTVSLLVVDGFGNGLMIPAGPLREKVAQGLARANAVIAMSDADLQGYGGPVLRARLATPENNRAAFAGKRVFAFAGIGRPEKFVSSLKEAGAIVTGTQFFADHHPYRDAEIAGLKGRAEGAQLVTTEKDFVRLPPALRAGIAVLTVEARFEQPQLLDRLLITV
jgi:tetraacyldisaccharide 4'-kinase